jgi:tetratricopeptide (TPR) repeat protein
MKKIFLLLLIGIYACGYSQNAIKEPKEIAKNSFLSSVMIFMYNENNNTKSIGSGFVIDKNVIVTNYHVIENATKGHVTLINHDKKYEIIRILKIDENNDLAILLIDKLNAPSMILGNDEITNIGDIIYVVGNPEGLQGTFSQGIISAFRNFDGKKLIQITAPLSQGSSGGALINTRGETIGVVVSSILEGQNLNFAIPISYVLNLHFNAENETISKSQSVIKDELDESSIDYCYYNDAIYKHTKAIELNPNFAESYYDRGEARLYIEDYEGAIIDFNKAIELDPKYIEAYLNRGYAKGYLQDISGAIADYSIAIALDPNYEDAYFSRGFAKNFLDDFKGAIADYDMAIKLNQDNASAFFNRGLAKFDIKDYSGSIDDLSQTIKIDPYHIDAYINRANAKCFMKDYKNAIFDFNQAILMNPEDADIYHLRGKAKTFLEDYKGAISDFNKAISLNQNFAKAYYDRGFSKLNLQDYRGAIVDCNNALIINPIYAEAYFVRGAAYVLIGQINTGCIDLSKAGELGYIEAYEVIKQYCK